MAPTKKEVTVKAAANQPPLQLSEDASTTAKMPSDAPAKNATPIKLKLMTKKVPAKDATTASPGSGKKAALASETTSALVKTKSNKRAASPDPEGAVSAKHARTSTPSPNDTPDKVVRFSDPEPAPPVFCCADMEGTDPNALYTCDNATCLQRHLLKIFTTYMKGFEWSIPALKDSRNSKYLIQVIKYQPVIAKELSTSRVKRGKNVEWAQYEPGRYFVEAREDLAAVFAEVMYHEADVQIMCERMIDSEMEFACGTHDEIKFKCSIWKVLGQTNTA